MEKEFFDILKSQLEYSILKYSFVSKILINFNVLNIRQVLDFYNFIQINNKVISVYMHHSINEEVLNKVQRVTGIGRQEFPFNYRRCPIFYTRSKMNYYQGLINKVLDKLQLWKASFCQLEKGQC